MCPVEVRRPRHVSWKHGLKTSRADSQPGMSAYDPKSIFGHPESVSELYLNRLIGFKHGKDAVTARTLFGCPDGKRGGQQHHNHNERERTAPSARLTEPDYNESIE